MMMLSGSEANQTKEPHAKLCTRDLYLLALLRKRCHIGQMVGIKSSLKCDGLKCLLALLTHGTVSVDNLNEHNQDIATYRAEVNQDYIRQTLRLVYVKVQTPNKRFINDLVCAL